MTTLSELSARLISLFRGRELDREFDEELTSHIDLATEEHLRRGMSPSEARRRALIMLGGIESSRQLQREARGLAWAEGLAWDLRHAVRGLLRDRSFALTAIVILALAIGLNAAVFSVVNTILFRGFPLVERNDRLLYMQERNPQNVCCMSYPDFEEWRAQSKSFAGMAFIAGKPVSLDLGGSGRAIETSAATVSSNAFALLGVRPALGRDFTQADEAPGAPQAIILSYRFWQARFGGRGDIVGRLVRANQLPATVIGVMPDGFDFPEESNFWMPLEHTVALNRREPGGYMAFGRLKDGVAAETARAELGLINRRLASEWPATNRDVTPRVDTHAQFFIGPDAGMIYGSVWTAAWFVLLMACANLTNLTLARTTGRSREFSTRLAMGAARGRMARPIFMESLLLASLGGGLGWWIAKWGVHIWNAATQSRYQILDYTPDSDTLVYLAATTIVAAILFSIVPIVRIWRLDVNGALKSDARGSSQGRRGKYVAAALVAVQMALAIILLSGAGVLLRSFLKVVTADLGVKAPEKVLVGHVTAPRDKYPSPQSRINLVDRLKARLIAIPGVESETLANTVPPNNPGFVPFELETSLPGADGKLAAPTVTAGPDYIRTIGATMVAGRDFTEADLPGSQPVAMVNQSFAARYWPGENALGKRLRLNRPNTPGEWRTVVGVISNIKQGDPTRQKFLPVIYEPWRQNPAWGVNFLVRTSVPANALAAAVQDAVRKLDPDISPENFSTLEAKFAFEGDLMDIAHSEMGKHAAVAPIFAALALLLAAIGLYAVIAHSVGQRTREIGIRVAVGAASADIRRLIFGEGMLPVAIGLTIGLAASLGVNRILQSQLVGVSPYDPVTFALGALVLVAVALVGCRIPVQRAIRVDPAVALRQE